MAAGLAPRPGPAAVPVAEAVGGVLVPALLYTAVNLGGSGDITGWAIPTASDIAFALAVWPSSAPTCPRRYAPSCSPWPSSTTFSRSRSSRPSTPPGCTWGRSRQRYDLQVAPLLLALVPLALVTIAVQRRIRSWWLRLPLAATTWTLVHASGVHATVVGKPVGVLGVTWLVARFTRAELDADLAWWDALALAMLAGVGFTVSLLIGELAFGTGSDRDNHLKVAVLAGSITAAALAGILLRARSNGYQRLFAEEAAHADHDGTSNARDSDG